MTSKERFKIIPEVFLILIDNGKVLLLRRYQTGYEDGNYGLPAGHHDGNETMRQALAREANEEAGLTINPQNLEHALTLHRWCGDHERIGFYFTAKKWAGEVTNMEPDKCDDLSWFPINQLPENIIPYIRIAIDCHQKGINYYEYNWPETIHER